MVPEHASALRRVVGAGSGGGEGRADSDVEAGWEVLIEILYRPMMDV